MSTGSTNAEAKRQGTAAVLTQFNGPLELRRFPLPAELGVGEGLLRVELAGVCGSDRHLWQGRRELPLPHILGHEIVGILTELGPGLTRDAMGMPLKVGDRVVVGIGVSCGACLFCSVNKQPASCLNRQAYGFTFSPAIPPHFGGGYAEYVVLRAGTILFRIDPEVSPDRVIMAACAGATMARALERGNVQAGETVVIQGAGPLGLFCAALARNLGCRRVVVIGRSGGRLDAALEIFGATDVLPRELDVGERVQQVQDWTGGYGADVVVECGGSPASVPEGLDMLRVGGRYLWVGFGAPVDLVNLQPFDITRRQLSVIGSWGSDARHLWHALEVAQAPGNDFSRAISHRFGLAEATRALEVIGAGAAVKAVIEP